MNKIELKLIQDELAGLGLFDSNNINVAEETRRAVMKFQRMHNHLNVDGIPGPMTIEALFTPDFDRPDLKKPLNSKRSTNYTWPKHDEMEEFYGAPGTNLEYVHVPFPLILAWDPTTTITRFQCNVKLITVINSLYTEIAKQYSEEDIANIGLNIFGGCFANRKTRGSKTKISVHAHGAAIDYDPKRNQLRWGRDKARLAQPDAAKFFDIVRDHGAISLGIEHNFDWMHIGWRTPG